MVSVTQSTSNLPKRFAHRVAFITGIARGQGRSHAVRLASQGAAIIGIDICAPFTSTSYPAASIDDLDETVALVEQAGGKILAQVADVRDGVAVQSVVNQGVELFGRLDYVVANAGICSYGRLWEITEEQWNETVDVNLTGVWQTLRATVPHIIAGGSGGSIVLTSSGAGLKGLPMLAHYGATKWGLVGMARTLAVELGPESIRVNTVHPTAVRTPMGKDPSLRALLDDNPRFRESFGNILPTGSIEPHDVTDAVEWLLSDAARSVTGIALPVDAGASQR